MTEFYAKTMFVDTLKGKRGLKVFMYRFGKPFEEYSVGVWDDISWEMLCEALQQIEDDALNGHRAKRIKLVRK